MRASRTNAANTGGGRTESPSSVSNRQKSLVLPAVLQRFSRVWLIILKPRFSSRNWSISVRRRLIFRWCPLRIPSKTMLSGSGSSYVKLAFQLGSAEVVRVNRNFRFSSQQPHTIYSSRDSSALFLLWLGL